MLILLPASITSLLPRPRATMPFTSPKNTLTNVLPFSLHFTLYFFYLHCIVGIKLLEVDLETSWKEQYTLCMDAYKLQADMQNITGCLTHPRCDHLLARAKTNIEKAQIYLLLHVRYEAEVYFLLLFLYSFHFHSLSLRLVSSFYYY